MTVAEPKLNFKIKTDTLYLTLMGELWGVYFEDLVESWPCCNGTAPQPMQTPAGIIEIE